MLATSYPLLDAFWTMLWFFAMIIWIWTVIAVFSDIIRSHDISGWSKALWSILIILFPFLGVFVYLIARGSKMRAHEIEASKAQEAAYQNYIKDAAGTSTGGTSDELTKLVALRDRGVLSEAEFQQQKEKVLAS